MDWERQPPFAACLLSHGSWGMMRGRRQIFNGLCDATISCRPLSHGLGELEPSTYMPS